MTARIPGGIYLVADAALQPGILLRKLRKALRNGVRAVQLYNTENRPVAQCRDDILAVCHLCHHYQVPVLVNNYWQLLVEIPLDGVHFDGIPSDLERIKKTLDRRFYMGITCTNDLSVVRWADDNHMDYVSFCAMFPTSSALSCEIVSFETVRKARTMTRMPIFLAGGIYPDTIGQLAGLPFDGVAVISGIMASSDIALTTRDYVRELQKIKQHAHRNDQ